jgi:quercetin dioxygenase-like cupin family protein
MSEPITSVSPGENRRTETASTRATTLASPTVGGSTRTSLWRVAMDAGATGPRHTIDSEQIWTVLSGAATIHSDHGETRVTEGDTVIMPADALRTVVADTACTFLVCGSPDALATVAGSDAGPVSPPWVL